MFLVIYAKIIDEKKKGLSFDGVFIGPECISEDEAHEVASVICTEQSKNIIITRIWDLDKISQEEALRDSQSYFRRIYSGMVKASQMLERPVVKKKKLKQIRKSRPIKKGY